MRINAGSSFGLYNVEHLRITTVPVSASSTAAGACAGRCPEAVVRHVGIVCNAPCTSVVCVPSLAVFSYRVRGQT